MEYNCSAEGITIAVEGDKHEARRRIAMMRFDALNCKLTDPTNGTYKPTVLATGAAVESITGRRALFSGVISGRNFLSDYGLTVGHLFADVGETVRFDGDQVGTCRAIVTSINISTKKLLTTADIAYIFLDSLKIKNGLNICLEDDRSTQYPITILKEFISWKDVKNVEELKEVVVVGRDNKTKIGVLHSVYFTIKNGEEKRQLYNTLAVTNRERNCAITEDGDSGALVVYRPVGDENVLKVIGMVLGNRTQDGKSMTIVNRLWDVLDAVGNDEYWRSHLYQPGQPQFDDSDVDFVYV